MWGHRTSLSAILGLHSTSDFWRAENLLTWEMKYYTYTNESTNTNTAMSLWKGGLRIHLHVLQCEGQRHWYTVINLYRCINLGIFLILSVIIMHFLPQNIKVGHRLLLVDVYLVLICCYHGDLSVRITTCNWESNEKHKWLTHDVLHKNITPLPPLVVPYDSLCWLNS